MKIELNKDEEIVCKIRTALKKTGGYCPCSSKKDTDHKCMCKEFLERKETGLCHCGLYNKTEV